MEWYLVWIVNFGRYKARFIYKVIKKSTNKIHGRCIDKGHQRMMVDMMFMIIPNWRLYLTAVTPTVFHQMGSFSDFLYFPSNSDIKVHCKSSFLYICILVHFTCIIVYSCTYILVILCSSELMYLYTCVLVYLWLCWLVYLWTCLLRLRLTSLNISP